MSEIILECKDLQLSHLGRTYTIGSFFLPRHTIALLEGDACAGISTHLELLSGVFTAGFATEPAATGRLKRTEVKPDTSQLGKIIFMGNPLYEMSAAQRGKNIGVIFENPEIAIIGSTVEEDYLHARLAAGGKPNREGISEELVRYGLAAKLSRRTHELSGGERQRLNCATALDKKPRLIIADLTSTNLDREFIREFFGWIKAACREGSSAILAGIDAADIESTDIDSGFKRYRVDNGSLSEARTPFTPPAQEQGINLKALLKSRHISTAIALEMQGLHWRDRTLPVTLKLHQGEIGILLGRNGSGKTTIANILLSRKKDRDLAGNYELHDSLPLVALQHPERTFLRTTVKQELPVPELRNLCAITQEEENSDPLKLPRAKQKLLSVAVALYNSHHLAILDEPTCGLDYQLKERFIALLNHFSSLAVLIITHDEAIEALSDQKVEIGPNLNRG